MPAPDTLCALTTPIPRDSLRGCHHQKVDIRLMAPTHVAPLTPIGLVLKAD